MLPRRITSTPDTSIRPAGHPKDFGDVWLKMRRGDDVRGRARRIAASALRSGLGLRDHAVAQFVRDLVFAEVAAARRRATDVEHAFLSRGVRGDLGLVAWRTADRLATQMLSRKPATARNALDLPQLADDALRKNANAELRRG